MGKKLDALLGRNNFKTYKFKPQVNLAISRLAVLKNQRQVKCSQARSDVVQLLQQGFHERALLRVEHVIKEQNMLDAFIMMEGYCNLLTERVHLIEQDKVCPDELKEAISTLLYAASRCGEFPELQEIRALFTSRYGKEFVGRAIELRNNCGVNAKMIQKLSTRLPGLDNRMKVLKEIATEHGIALQLEGGSSIPTEENLDVSKKQNQAEAETSTSSSQGKRGDTSPTSPKEMGKDGGFSDSFKTRKKYKDVADAAQAAFESAAYAAEAARAAVELSRSDSHDPDDHNSPRNQPRKAIEKQKLVNHASESKSQEFHSELQDEESKHNKSAAEPDGTISSSDSTEENVYVTTMSFDEVDPVKLLEKDVVLYESDSEDSGLSCKQMPSSSKAQKVEGRHPTAPAAGGSALPSKEHVDMVKGPISVRTRRVLGY
ncbi:IST1-like protein [Melia azedarach]|uniref:IST1-like protein n=1 Tax=Melia azedarach TaxID=155640 RepID=A0ACC1XGA6_MELAZ|nr:IST1-like protein [Melia azedarach]